MSASPPFPSPEALLTQSRFLRPIVRALLRGQDGEDDVLQETAVRAWRAQDAAVWPQAWLARIARNLSLDRLRAVKRAERLRERAVEAEAPSAHEVLQQEEVRQRLVHAVLSLPQPYRGIVLLRFWEDLTPAAIALRLAVPGATVRSQLARGLQLLRERLDGEPGGRSAWRAVLLPYASWPAGTAATLARIVAMTKLKVAAVAMVSVVCGLGLWWWSADPALDPAGVRRSSDRGGTPVVVADVPRPPGAAAASTVALASDRAAMHAELRVRGRVTHKGQPFAGLTTTLQWFDGFATDGAPAATFSVTSDAAGGFEWRGPMRHEPGMVRVVAAPDAVPAKLWCTPELVLQEQAEAELAVTVVPLDRVVFGRVHTRDGAPIEGARLDVNLWPETEVVSGADGRYEMRVPAPGYPMTVRAPGFAERLVDSFLPEGVLRHEFDVELLPGAKLAGRVVDAAGSPVAAAKVTASGAFHGVDTESDGTFSIDGLRPGERHEVVAKKPGFQSGQAYGETGGDPVEIVLQHGQRVDLRVRDAAGAPVAGAIVHLVADAMSGWRRLGITGADGAFAVQDLPAHAAELVVQRLGFQTARQPVDAREVQGELIVTLVRGWSIRGTVVDSSGKPIAAASIYCERRGAAIGSQAVGTRADSDAEGRFEVRDIPAELCVLYAYHDDYTRGEFTFVGGAVAETTLQLTRALVFAGRVVDGVTGAPITRFSIDLEPDRARPVFVEARPFADEQGRFRFSHPQLPAGVVQKLRVSAAGFAPAEARVTPVAEPTGDQVAVPLFAGVTVTGIVRDPANGQPLAGVTLGLVTDDPRLRPNDGPATDASGRFALASVPAGEQRLRLQHPDRPESVFGPFTVARGPGTLEVQPTMGVGVVLRGRVTGGGGAAGKLVSAFRTNDRTVTATIDDQGTFELRGLGAGRTTLHLLERSGRARLLRVDVGDVDLAGVEFRLSSGPGALRVAVDGMARGEVAVRRVGEQAGECVTDDEVAFTGMPVRIDGLVPGRYRVIATSETGDRQGRIEVEVGTGEVEVRVDCKARD